MNRKSSRLAAILTVFFVVLTLIPGCGKTSTGGNQVTTTPAATTPAAATPAAATPVLNAKKPPLELTALMIQYGSPTDPNSSLWKAIEEKLNIHYKNIDWVPDADYQSKLNIVISSGSLPDIMFTANITDPTVFKAINGGLFADLTPVLGDFSKWPNLKNINPDAWRTSKVNGKNYIFPRSRDNYDMPVAHVRGDWLKKLNMEVPKTWDEFGNYLRGVLAADLDGNGKKDTIGMTSLSLENWSSGFGPGDKLIVRPQGKTTGIVNVKLTEAYAKELEYFSKWFKEGLISPEYAMLKGQQQEDMFVAGISAMYQKNIWHRKRMDNELQKKDPNAFSTLVYSLKGPDGVSFNYDKGYAGGLLVSSKVTGEKLERLVEFMNNSAAPENFNLISFGIEGQHHKMVDGFPQLTDEGKKLITQAITYPFCLATQKYAKVDSPLADAAYNKAVRKECDDLLMPVYKSYKNPLSMEVLQSNSWASFLSQRKDEFAAFVTDVVTGAKTIDQFREYQKKLLADPLVMKSFDELQKSYDDFGLPKQ